MSFKKVKSIMGKPYKEYKDESGYWTLEYNKGTITFGFNENKKLNYANGAAPQIEKQGYAYASSQKEARKINTIGLLALHNLLDESLSILSKKCRQSIKHLRIMGICILFGIRVTLVFLYELMILQITLLKFLSMIKKLMINLGNYFIQDVLLSKKKRDLYIITRYYY